MIVFLHYAFTVLTISFHFSDKKKEAAHKKSGALPDFLCDFCIEMRGAYFT